MKIGAIIRTTQEDVYKQLNEKRDEKKRRNIKLTFSEVEKLMKHDSYKRVRGALRQK